MGGHRNAGEHFLHVDGHKADGQRLSLEGDADRHRDNDALFGALRMEDGDLRLGERAVVKVVFIDIALGSGRGVDQALRIHKGKLVQLIELLHARLIRLQVRLIADILLGHQVNGHADRLDLLLKIVLHDLLPASGKLVEIQKTYGADRFFCIPPGACAHPHRSRHQNDCQDQASDDGDRRGIILSSVIHQGFTPFFFLNLEIYVFSGKHKRAVERHAAVRRRLMKRRRLPLFPFPARFPAGPLLRASVRHA